MSHILENLEHHWHCIVVWEKYFQEGNPMTDDILANLNEHKRIYRLLKDQFIAETEPHRYRVNATNTFTGLTTHSEWFDSQFEANSLKQNTEDIYPFMLCTIEEQ
jgi:hypothetical protein